MPSYTFDRDGSSLYALIGAFACVTADGHVGSRPRMLSEGQVTDLVGGPRKNARLREECRIDAMLGGVLVLPSLPYAKPFEMPPEFGGVPLQPIDCISSQMNGKWPVQLLVLGFRWKTRSV